MVSWHRVSVGLRDAGRSSRLGSEDRQDVGRRLLRGLAALRAVGLPMRESRDLPSVDRTMRASRDLPSVDRPMRASRDLPSVDRPMREDLRAADRPPAGVLRDPRDAGRPRANAAGRPRATEAGPRATAASHSAYR
jgi:hypothetical protein